MKKITLTLLIFVFSTIILSAQNTKTQTIQNNYVAVKIALKGAELTGFFDKGNQKEHIWQAQKPWKHHAPVLFPIVGKLKNRTYQYKGKTYHMKNHGFASGKLFKVVEKSPQKVVLELNSDEETLKIYPFHFNLKAVYKLSSSTLSIDYIVTNTGNDTMYFSIGAHPGFIVPWHNGDKFEDYQLVFQKKETADRLLLEPESRLVSRQVKKQFLNNQNKLALSHDLFKDRVIILKGLKSNYVRLQSPKHSDYLEIGIKDFPYTGIWSTQESANLLCIEPWYGHSDYIDTNQDLTQKAGIIKLPPHQSFTMHYYIKSVATVH